MQNNQGKIQKQIEDSLFIARVAIIGMIGLLALVLILGKL
jgi:hypothetical protein